MSQLSEAREAVFDQCRNVVDAHEHRATEYEGITLNEAQEIAVLRIRLDDLAEMEAIGRAEAS